MGLSVKVGAKVAVRDTAPSEWAGQRATVVAIEERLKLYRLRFADDFETWFERKEIRKP